MKKVIAVLLIAIMLVGGCTAAFAETHAIMTWNEKLQHWEIQVIDDGPDVYMNPNPQYHDALSNGEDPFKNIDFHPVSDDSEWIDMDEVDDFYW